MIICSGHAPAAGLHATQTIVHEMSATEMADMGMPDTMSDHHAGPAKGRGSPEHGGSGCCPFAVAATAMASGDTEVASAAIPDSPRQINLSTERFVPRGTIAPTRLPRGPPSLA